MGTDVTPASLDAKTKVRSKDVVFSPDHNLVSRLYVPDGVKPNQKLPVIVYYHGGGFCIETPFTLKYHEYVNTLSAQANAIAVSVDYRLAPEHPLPVGYDDSWAALQWIASHAGGSGPEEWLNSHADFGRVILAGDSAGKTSGCDDPWINPVFDPNLEKLGCGRVLVVVAERDILKERGKEYYEALKKKTGWGGEVVFWEVKEEDHVFHLQKSTCDNALSMNTKIVEFINGGK
ncbi:unnamed protein product [Linum tenue]|uniref:Alpha/beta hydrolase fold-3 domain-containing protein n=1 Tax=Linum tenue TaxID=586396 RepID=A0AAV0MJY1_9ROSI|nr:unnamed protein product [Linum tenue]